VADCCSFELGAKSGWVPAAAAVVGSPNVLSAAEVPCSEYQIQSENAEAELMVLPQGLPLLFCLTGCDAVFLGNGHVD
jgi:hypothetical protein